MPNSAPLRASGALAEGVSGTDAPASNREFAVAASFRDPAGFVFRRSGTLYRHVAAAGLPAYRALMDSGLYAELTEAGLLVKHQEVESGITSATLRPEVVPFISYPYEWCFGQLQDAALATLDIQRRAIERGLWLKDASAYNIQFHQGKPVLIDTLSFEPYREGEPWPAYKQFCQHFLAPLSLMAQVDVSVSQLLRVHLDGIPLELASKLLPGKTRFQLGLLTHIHLHASAQARFADADADGAPAKGGARVTRTGLRGILDTLRGVVAAQKYEPKGTEWGDYYGNTNYTDAAMQEKRRLVAALLDEIAPRPVSAWDLGANNGAFSRLAAERGIPTLAWDIDPAAVEQNWRACRKRGETRLLPLVQDLTNPSPALGWASAERDSFAQRGPCNVVFALALIHHLAVTNNVPFDRIAAFMGSLISDGGHLIVEWVPAEDSQARRLLARRDGALDSYRPQVFRSAFATVFETVREQPVSGSQRILFLYRKRPDPEGDSATIEGERNGRSNA